MLPRKRYDPIKEGIRARKRREEAKQRQAESQRLLDDLKARLDKLKSPSQS